MVCEHCKKHIDLLEIEITNVEQGRASMGIVSMLSDITFQVELDPCKLNQADHDTRLKCPECKALIAVLDYNYDPDEGGYIVLPVMATTLPEAN